MLTAQSGEGWQPYTDTGQRSNVASFNCKRKCAAILNLLRQNGGTNLPLSSVSFCVAQRDYKRQEQQQQQLVGLVEIACTRLDLKEEVGRAKGLQRLQGVQLDRDRESAYERGKEREHFVCVCETKSKAQEQFKCVTEKRQTKQRVEKDRESINAITERGEEGRERKRGETERVRSLTGISSSDMMTNRRRSLLRLFSNVNLLQNLT